MPIAPRPLAPALAALVLTGCAARHPAAPMPAPAPSSIPRPSLKYPAARAADQVDDYHGVRVADPYRWLEDPDSPESRAWIEAQNGVTSSWLAEIPARARIHERLTRLWDFERFDVPFRKGGRTFFNRNDGLQNQSVLHVVDAPGASPRVLLDPNALSADGTVALSGLSVSEDGKHLAYGLSTSGSDWQEWRVRDVSTGADLSDHLKWIKFSGASWTRDGAGFYYSRYDEPNETTKLEDTNYYQKLWFHRLGTSQSEDVLVYERKDQKEWGFDGHVTDDGRYLVITVWKGAEEKTQVFYKDLHAPAAPVVELVTGFDWSWTFAGNEGSVFWFLTDHQAPRHRVVAIDLGDPAPGKWREIVPEGEDNLTDLRVVADRFVGLYLEDARSVVRTYDLAGKALGEVPLPGIGTAGGFTGERTDTDTYYSFASYTTPTTIFHHDFKTGTSEVFRRPKVDFDPSRFETRQVFFTSKDGTRVPMFLTHRKGLPVDGNNPTLLYGYGGFSISLTPAFSVGYLVWMEMGGVVAIPNLRGGGEYGEDWHQAGTKLRKQNVFDDFIAAAEWLIAEKVTRPERLAIAGGSNGGLLVGACLTQRPDLFGAALPAVGVLDMLRFHKFTIGWAWVPDYGSSDDPEQFKALHAYSPLHRVRPGTSYPATLITTADHDDRVVPAHSFKFAATLQAAQAGLAPVLIRIDVKAGHGAGKPTAKVIDETADRWSFLVRSLGVEVPATPGAAASP